MNEGGNFLAPRESSGELQTSSAARVTAEVQAMVVMAKRFPRDENQALSRIVGACKRPLLAERAVYAYPRGGQSVSGPSIRLAEVIANAWGNIQTGVKEVSNENGESKVVAYAWDMETNVREEREFVVKHERDKKGGAVKLTDHRDIYELTANMGARRKRACILAIIPADIVEAALNECDRTLAGDGKEPLQDKVRKAVLAFQEVGVSVAMLEKRLGHKLDACIPIELVQLHKVFVSIKDGFAKREDFFDLGGPGEAPQSASAADLQAKLQAPPAEAPQAVKVSPPAPPNGLPNPNADRATEDNAKAAEKDAKRKGPLTSRLLQDEAAKHEAEHGKAIKPEGSGRFA